MKVTYDVTVRVVIDVAGYAAEYDIEGLPPHEVIQQVRQDLAQAELANGQHHDWIVRQNGLNHVEWIKREPEVTVRPWFRTVNGM